MSVLARILADCGIFGAVVVIPGMVLAGVYEYVSGRWIDGW